MSNEAPVSPEGASNSARTFFTVLVVVIVIGAFFWFALSTRGGSDASTSLTGTATSSPIITVYTTAVANVRSCPSTDCKIVGTYQPNQSFDLTGTQYASDTDISQLPDWVLLNFSDGSSGYISKSVLSDTEIPTTETPSPTQTTVNSNAVTSGSACEEMANKAAQDEEDAAVGFLVTEMQVVQSHTKNGECYYELSYHGTGGSTGDVYETQIDEAPNNSEVAYCGRSIGGTVCYQNSEVISAATFHVIEANLLTN